MKKTSIFLSCVAIAAAVFTSCKSGNQVSPASAEGTTVAAGSIVFINLDKVLNEYDMANELSSAVQAKIEGIQQEVNRRGTKLQNDVNSFQEKINKGLITRSVAEVQSQQLQQKQAEFQNYAAVKEQEIAEEQQVSLNQIGNAIKEFLDVYRAEKGYGMIITVQGDILPAPVATADPSLDVTEDVIACLNAEYVKTKSKGDKAAAKAE